jgi:hypothetical protein
LRNATDVVASPITSIEMLNVGCILDAQDYLGNWHLAIIIDEKDARTKEVHFLPFLKANRNEAFTDLDLQRMAPAYSKTSIS